MDYEELEQLNGTEFEEFQKESGTNYLWVIPFILTSIITTVGNVMVIWTIVANKVMNTSINYLIICVAVSDTIGILARVFTGVYFLLHQSFPFVSWFCTLNEFTSTTTMLVTSFTLVVISTVQYRIMVHPFQPQINTGKSLSILSSIVLISMLICLPHLLYTSAQIYDGHIMCYLDWSSGQTIYHVLFNLLHYHLPIAWLLVTYIFIWKRMELNVDEIATKRDDLKMMTIVTVIYTFGLLPGVMTLIIAIFHPPLLIHITIHLLFWFVWMAYLTAMLKPIIYILVNRRFRRYFGITFPWFPLFKDDQAYNEILLYASNE